MGGLQLWWSDSALTPELHPITNFVHSEGTGNAAANGPAVGLQGGLGDVVFDGCLMRANVGYFG